MPTRPWLVVGMALGAFLACFSSGQAEAAHEKQRPNIVFMIVDDMGYAGLGCYGQEV